MLAIASFGQRLRQSRRRRLPFWDGSAIADPAKVLVAAGNAVSVSPDTPGDWSRTDPASTQGLPPAIRRGRIPTPPGAGIHLYLLSVALVAAAIVVILLGKGSYLLVHPATEMAAGDAEHNREAGESPRQTAATEADPHDEGTGTQQPVPGSVDDEAPPSSADAASSREEMPALPSTAAKATVPAVETMLMPALTIITEGDSGQSVQPVEADEPVDRPVAGAEASTAPDEATASEPTLSAVIRGIVNDAPDAATWILVDQTIRLWGIEPRSSNGVGSLVEWVRAKGPIECVPRAQAGRYQCFTATGEDIAEAALLVGAARAGKPTIAAYRKAEAEARRKGKGQWGKR